MDSRPSFFHASDMNQRYLVETFLASQVSVKKQAANSAKDIYGILAKSEQKEKLFTFGTFTPNYLVIFFLVSIPIKTRFLEDIHK